MNSALNDSLRDQFQLFARIAAAFTALVGVLVLVGWMLDSVLLKSVLPGLVSMKSNTALCFVVGGIALGLRIGENVNVAWRVLTILCATFVVAVGLLTLLEYHFGTNFGIDQLLFRDAGAVAAPPGRMSPATAVNFVLIGSALLLWDFALGWHIGQWLTLLAFLVAGLGLTGYVYGVESLYRIGIYSSMALHTALTFMVLAAATLSARPERGLTRLLAGVGTGSLLTRRLLPLALVAPLVLGWIRLEIERHHGFDTAFGTAWFALVNSLFVGVLVWRSGTFLNHLGEQRQEAELALRESEELFSKAFRLSVDYVLIVRMDDGRVIRANEALCRLLGRAPEAVIGQTVRDIGTFLSPDDQAVYHARLEREGEVLDFETMMQWHDQRLMPMSLSSRIISFHDETCRLVVFRDITERRKAETSLRQSEQRWRDLAEAMTPLVWTCTADGVLDYLSKQWYDYTGVSTDVPLSEAWMQAVHSEEIPGMVARWFECVAKEQPYEDEYQLRRADGVYRWCKVSAVAARDASGTIVKWYGSYTDVHQLKLAQTENERFAAIVESSADAITSQTLDGIIVSWNPGAQKLSGYSAQEIIGQPLSALAPLEFVAVEQEVRERVARTQQVEIFEAEQIHKNGRRSPISVMVSPILNANGQVTGIASIARDISERKRAEAALLRAKDELEGRVAQRTSQLEERSAQLEERSAQLEETNEQLQSARDMADAANLAKSEFLSRMSHELRTPLNAILGFGQIMTMGQRLNARDAEAVEHILKSGRHLLDLINEVLDIARIEAGHISLSPEPIHLAELVAEMLSIVRPLAAPRSIELVNSIEENDQNYVMADQQRCRQILLNLLSNAIKYNRDGGRVVVYYGPVDGLLRLNVADTGPGLSEDEQGKLFVPFERLGAENSQIEGTGIGLALCKRLVEAMKGNIGVESEPGQGSTFWVEFPTVKSQAEQLAKTVGNLGVGEIAPAREAQCTVLYIEDNLSNLKLIQSILIDRPDIKLLSAMQGRIGLELALQHRPDLILLDLHLPDITGEVVLRRLQAEPTTRAIPIVILSADAMPRQIASLSAAGASHYLTKPIDLREFLQVLDELLGEPVE